MEAAIQFHFAVNWFCRMIGSALGKEVEKLDPESIDAEVTAQALNQALPRGTRGVVSQGSSIMNIVAPHIEAFQGSSDEEQEDSEGADDEQEEKQVESDEVVDEL